VLVTPRWLGLHLLVLIAMAACVLLGRWQFDKALWGSGDLINLGYGLQWWSFDAIILYAWWRGARDSVRGGRPVATAPVASAADRAEPEPPRMKAASRRPAAPVGDEDDAELAAYNAYLARLSARSRA
jgi:DNA-binding transcriptional regulator of glucitol operon